MWYERTKQSKWKYKLLVDRYFSFREIPKELHIVIYKKNGKRLAEIKNGYIRILAGFVWDGATFAPDLPTMLRATLLHDLMCQISTLANCPYTRKQGDVWFNRVMKEDQVNTIIRLIYFNAVIPFGKCKEILFGTKREKGIFIKIFRPVKKELAMI